MKKRNFIFEEKKEFEKWYYGGFETECSTSCTEVEYSCDPKEMCDSAVSKLNSPVDDLQLLVYIASMYWVDFFQREKNYYRVEFSVKILNVSIVLYILNVSIVLSLG